MFVCIFLRYFFQPFGPTLNDFRCLYVHVYLICMHNVPGYLQKIKIARKNDSISRIRVLLVPPPAYRCTYTDFTPLDIPWFLTAQLHWNRQLFTSSPNVHRRLRVENILEKTICRHRRTTVDHVHCKVEKCFNGFNFRFTRYNGFHCVANAQTKKFLSLNDIG